MAGAASAGATQASGARSYSDVLNARRIPTTRSRACHATTVRNATPRRSAT
jgi:hypothetical protein